MTGKAGPRLGLAALLLAVAVLYLSGAVGRMVLDVDEALYIAAGNHMAATGDLVTPYVNGVRFLDKPPLLYWLLAGLDRLLGPGELAAHLPPVLSMLATTAILFWMGSRGAGPRVGLAAGAAFAFCIGSDLFTRETLPDGPLVACIALAMASYLGFRLGRVSPAAASASLGAAMAGAVLSKGLLGLVFPIATLLVVRFLDPEPRPIPLRDGILGLGSFLALAAPWHVAVALRNPGFLRHAVVNEQLLRFFGQREPADVVSMPLPVFWGLFLLWLAPWTVFLPAAWVAARAGLRQRDARGVLTRLALAWAAVVLVFFSASARLAHYAYAALPPLALLVGLALFPDPATGDPSRAAKGGFRALGWIGGALALAGAAAGLLIPWAGPALLGAGSARPDRAYDSDFGPLAGLPATLRQDLLPLAAVALGGLGLACLLARLLDARRRRDLALVALGGGVFVFGLAADRSLRACGDLISSRRFGVALQRTAAAGDRFFVLGDFETANSVACYARQRIELVDGRAPTLAYGLTLPGAPRLAVSRGRLAELWDGPGRMFLLADKDRLPGLGLGPVFVIAESTDRVLVSNRTESARRSDSP